MWVYELVTCSGAKGHNQPCGFNFWCTLLIALLNELLINYSRQCLSSEPLCLQRTLRIISISRHRALTERTFLHFWQFVLLISRFLCSILICASLRNCEQQQPTLMKWQNPLIWVCEQKLSVTQCEQNLGFQSVKSLYYNAKIILINNTFWQLW